MMLVLQNFQPHLNQYLSYKHFFAMFGDGLKIYKKGRTSDSQSLLCGPFVVRKISLSGPTTLIQINIVCFAEHWNIWIGPLAKKFGNHWIRMLLHFCTAMRQRAKEKIQLIDQLSMKIPSGEKNQFYALFSERSKIKFILILF